MNCSKSIHVYKISTEKEHFLAQQTCYYEEGGINLKSISFKFVPIKFKKIVISIIILYSDTSLTT